MSGGHFNYIQFRFSEPIEELENLIINNNMEDEYGYSHSYSDKTLAKFRKTKEMLEIASMALHRVDWLVSGDDSEESFHKRWEEDLIQLIIKEKK